MNSESSDISELIQMAADGDQAALKDLFDRYRVRLKRMVRLRISRRLQGRIDDSDVLQEAFLELSKKLADYLPEQIGAACQQGAVVGLIGEQLLIDLDGSIRPLRPQESEVTVLTCPRSALRRALPDQSGPCYSEPLGCRFEFPP